MSGDGRRLLHASCESPTDVPNEGALHNHRRRRRRRNGSIISVRDRHSYGNVLLLYNSDDSGGGSVRLII